MLRERARLIHIHSLSWVVENTPLLDWRCQEHFGILDALGSTVGEGSCTPGGLSTYGMTRMDYQMSGKVSIGLWTVGMAKSATWLCYKQGHADKRPSWQIAVNHSGLSLGKRQRECLLPEWYPLLVCAFTLGKLAKGVGSSSEVSAIWSSHWGRRRIGYCRYDVLTEGKRVGIHATVHSMFYRLQITAVPGVAWFMELLDGYMHWELNELNNPMAAALIHCVAQWENHPYWVVYKTSIKTILAAE